MRPLTDAERELAGKGIKLAHMFLRIYARRHPHLARRHGDDLRDACYWALIDAARSYRHDHKWSFATQLRWSTQREIAKLHVRLRPSGYRYRQYAKMRPPKTHTCCLSRLLRVPTSHQPENET